MINRDEFLKMAREAGFQTGYVQLADVIASYPIVMHTGNHCALEVERLINIALERAAVVGQLTAINGIEVASAIRALKTQGE